MCIRDRRYEWYLLIQVSDVLQDSPDGAVRNGLLSFGGAVLEFDIAADTDGAENWWKLRKNISEAQKREGFSIKHDIAVPVSCVAEFITRADAALRNAFPGVRIVVFGHMGDGNIHYNVSMPDAAQNKTFIAQQEGAVNKLVYAVVRELNGDVYKRQAPIVWAHRIAMARCRSPNSK